MNASGETGAADEPDRAADEPDRQVTPQQVPVSPDVYQPSRRGLVLETWFVQVAFLVPGVLAAVDLLAEHASGTGTIKRIPAILTGHPAANLVLATVNYTTVGVVVPLGLLLLSRTGQNPATLGLTRPKWRTDVWPAVGLAAAGYGSVLALTIALAPLIATHKSLFVSPSLGHLPAYYVIYGLAASAITAITEETLVNGYLLIRLEQLGWDPSRALVFSLILRTSYHVYYGLGFVLTIPLGYFLTRSFQKHRRLMRPILAHFIYDAVLFTIAVLAS
jgi:membrane protease YdiL (CAAX protease family)